MKHKNNICEFASERSELLLQNFRASIARQSVISAKRAFKEAVDSPAPRFWVSEARALRVISMMMKGEDPTAGMRPEKQKMFKEIFRRVSKIKKENPDLPLGDIVFEVVNSEAPQSYLDYRYAARIIRIQKHKICTSQNFSLPLHKNTGTGSSAG